MQKQKMMREKKIYQIASGKEKEIYKVKCDEKKCKIESNNEKRNINSKIINEKETCKTEHEEIKRNIQSCKRRQKNLVKLQMKKEC